METENKPALSETRPVQFRLRTLFVGVTLAATYLAVARHMGAGVFVPLLVLLVCLAGWPKKPLDRPQFACGTVLLQIASIAGVWVGLSVYHTHGLVGSGIHWFTLLFASVAAAVHCAARAYRTTMVVGVLLTAGLALDVPRQLVLTTRLEHLRHETTRIVAYLEQQRAMTGSYPGDLSGYRFQRQELAEYIKYWPETRPGQYFVDYHPIKDAGIQHWYCPAKGWGYYDD